MKNLLMNGCEEVNPNKTECAFLCSNTSMIPEIKGEVDELKAKADLRF